MKSLDEYWSHVEDWWNADGKAQKKAQENIEQIQDMWEGFIPPELDNVNLEDFQYGGDVDPELIGYSTIDSAFDDVYSDPEMKAKQIAALDSLDAIIEGGGFNASDVANMNRVQNDVAQADKGRRDAILQNMQMRGMGGSGNELLAQLQSSQAATDRANETGLDINALAQQRALDAIMQQGSLAGGIRGQGFAEQSQIAQAQDAISKFNASNTLAKDQYNASNKYDASKYNQGAKQDILNKNTANAHQEHLWNKNGKKQQQFDNELGVMSGKTGAYTQGAQSANHQAGQAANSKTNTVSGIASAVASIYSDERKKKDIQSVDTTDVTEFLKAVHPKSFKYKGDDQDKLGMILQDVKDTELGQKIIKEDEDGLMMYDTQSLDGIMLAALSEMAKKGKI